MHMEIINNGKNCNNGEISAAVKIHVGGDEKQKINTIYNSGHIYI